MRYLADILTFSRFVLAFSIWFLALLNGSPELVIILFLLAELTDAFDGTCAKKWPFPKNKEPKYRKYAVKYDMYADTFLWFVLDFFILLRVNRLVGLIILIGTALICLTIELIVYGKLFGHPDDCKKTSLCRRNFPLAKKIILARRFFYLFTIVFMSIFLLFSTHFSLMVKIIILSLSLLVGLFLWFFLKQRRKNISRNAEKLEKKLEKSN